MNKEAKGLKIMLLAARSSIHTVRWANALAARGYRVSVATMHFGGDPLDERVKVSKLPFPRPIGYVANVSALKRVIKNEEPDLLHIHYASGYGLLGSLTGFQPRIVSVWGSDIYNFPYKSRVHKRLIQSVLGGARWICSTSEVMAKQTIRIFPKAADNISVTPFGVDLELFKQTDQGLERGTVVVGTVKTLARKYGIDILLKGFAKARSELSLSDPELAESLRLVICGNGPDEGSLTRLAVDLGVERVTNFKGPIPHGQVPAELRNMDIYVAMSREESESFGVAIIEASACELPVIVSGCGGLPEVVADCETGYVVRENTPAKLSERLIELCKDAKLRGTMGRRGRQRVREKYNWDENVNLMETLYADVLETSPTVFR